MAISFFVYSSVGILGIYTFGTDLTSNVLDNVDKETNVYSYIIRVMFSIVLACHIPFVFFPTKESFLIIVDEIQNNSMKHLLERNIEKKTRVSVDQVEP